MKECSSNCENPAVIDDGRLTWHLLGIMLGLAALKGVEVGITQRPKH